MYACMQCMLVLHGYRATQLTNGTCFSHYSKLVTWHNMDILPHAAAMLMHLPIHGLPGVS